MHKGFVVELNFGQIPQLTMELAALERLQIKVYPGFLSLFF